MITGPIPVSVLSGITDRLGVQYQTISNSITTSSAVGGGLFADRVTDTEIYAVERDLLTAAYNLDNSMSGVSMFPYLQPFSQMTSSIASHMSAIGANNLTGFLTRSGLDVSDQFAQLYKTLRSENLPSSNVFFEKPLTIGTVQKAAGNWSFTHVQALGTGSGNFSTINHAAQTVQAYVPSGITIGAANVNLSVSVTGPTGASGGTRLATILSGSVAGTAVSLTSGTDVILDITASGTTGGTNGDQVNFRSIPERTPTL